MSRIGRKPVVIPKGVQVSITKDTIVAKGPKGSLTLARHEDVEIRSEPERVDDTEAKQRSELPRQPATTRAELSDRTRLWRYPRPVVRLAAAHHAPHGR